jgi:hypothetical protein
VLASRGLGKTFFFSEAYPIWRAIYHPGKVTFILSATKSQAEEVLDHIKKQVEENPELQWLIPQRKGLTWNKSQIKFSNGSRIVTAGFGTRKRGLHPDCIIVDDGLTDEAMYSPTVRRKTIKYFYSAVTNMLNPGGIIIVVGTPMHQSDLYGTLKANSAYTYGVFPAIVNGIPVFPKRFSYDFLMAKKREIGALNFAQEIECKPMSDEASLFPQQLFQGDGVECMGLTLGMPYEFWRDAGVSLFMGVDFALSAQTGADYTVVFVMGVDDAGNRYWVDIFREHGLPYKSQLSLINTVARKYDVHLAVLEANQAQRIFGDDLINKTDLPIKKYNTGVEKHSLSKGIPGLRILLENKKMRIPRGDKRSVDLTDIAIEEFGGFTYVDGKLESVGEHDDMAMACFAAQTMVTTDTGPRPIETIRVGDLVLTHRSRWRRVLGTMERDYRGAAYRMRASGQAAFIVTPEHPILRALPAFTCPQNRLIPDPASWAFVPAEHVRVGRKMAGDYALMPMPRWPAARPAFDLADYVDFRRDPRGGCCWKRDEQHIWWRSDRRLPRRLEVTPELAFVIGLYLAEGSTGGGGNQNRTRGKSARHCVCFGLNQKETYLSTIITEVFAFHFEARCDAHHSRTHGGMQVAARSVPAAAFFAQMGVGSGKSLPDEWMGWAPELRVMIVRGWLAGDGSLVRAVNGDSLRAVSIAPKLLAQMQWCLRDVGLDGCVRPFKNVNGFGGDKCSPAWCLTINGQSTRKLLSNMLGAEMARWDGIRICAPKEKTQTRTLAQRDGIAVRIIENVPLQYEGKVYNLQIEEDESYVVEGIAVHNCWLANIAVKSGGFRASFGDEEVKQAMQTGRDTLRAADVPDDTQPMEPADIIDAYDGELEYDMFGNPVPRDGEIIGDGEAL